ncbi:hypothetical protein NVV94_09320 [Pseudomonas sp. LS1212]|uniref:hypothetical protein n=1 Tax=Pseudomonas sp. LS1212 TaxID=2972478 RepID=UPI00215D490A|nr:hypothetical protein [Pseudomonas sp. LS1212]UVJ45724.1 hypothetical protein NVV94_09320 [Pseudomonas sp. LS1212]
MADLAVLEPVVDQADDAQAFAQAQWSGNEVGPVFQRQEAAESFEVIAIEAVDVSLGICVFMAGLRVVGGVLFI